MSVATTILEDDGFKVETKRVTDAKAKDRVLEEDPGAGGKAKEGSTVTLTVSDGPGDGTIPDVARLGRDEAEQVLREAGYSPQVTEVFSAAVASGLAVGTSPAAGTKQVKDSDVTLEISRGPQQVSVPDVTGDEEATAVKDLKALGFVVEIDPQAGDEKPGSVTGQTPAARTEAQIGSTVRIVIDRAPKQVEVPGVVGESQSAAAERDLRGRALGVLRHPAGVGPQAERHRPGRGTRGRHQGRRGIARHRDGGKEQRPAAALHPRRHRRLRPWRRSSASSASSRRRPRPTRSRSPARAGHRRARRSCRR